ncbi:MAG: multidrug efflux MATE transporter FepA, partial [Novibacillus thermophilus]
DWNPNLTIASLVLTAIVNIGLNFVFLYVLGCGVTGAALSTILAAVLGILVLCLHFGRKNTHLRFVRLTFDRELILRSVIIGFPSFLAEVGIAVFALAHNVTLKYIAGTDGVAAFSVLNYVHSVMLMVFPGIGTAIQPLISYYHGAKNCQRERQTVQIAVRTAIVAGVLSFLVGLMAARPIVAIFGDFPQDIMALAVTGVRLFFIAYLFMGVNFVMMTYYQSIGHVGMATWITAAREIVVMLAFLLILPPLFGINGVWLAIPLSEIVVLATIYAYHRRHF